MLYISIEQEAVLRDSLQHGPPARGRLTHYYIVVSDVPWGAEGPDWAPVLIGPIAEGDGVELAAAAVAEMLRRLGAGVVLSGQEPGTWAMGGIYLPHESEKDG